MSSDTVTLDPPRCPGRSLLWMSRLWRSRPADPSAGSYMILLSDGSGGPLECQGEQAFQCAQFVLADAGGSPGLRGGVSVVSQRSDVTFRSENSVSNGCVVEDR